MQSINIQKTHIHFFHGKLLGEVATMLDVVSDSDVVMRAKVIPWTLYKSMDKSMFMLTKNFIINTSTKNHGLPILTLELWKKTRQWHKKYEKYQFCTQRRPENSIIT